MRTMRSCVVNFVVKSFLTPRYKSAVTFRVRTATTAVASPVWFTIFSRGQKSLRTTFEAGAVTAELNPMQPSFTGILTVLPKFTFMWPCIVTNFFIIKPTRCTHLLTYLLTPCSRALLEKLTGSAASQEIPRIFETRRFITVLTSARHLSLSWANSIQSP